jgi:HEPN domain-containing protein
MSNFTDAINWFQMALADIPRISRSFSSEDFADSAYRLQFCSEKIVKGILLMYGIQFKKYHEVSTILFDDVLPTPTLGADESKILEKIANEAYFIETLSTAPRYGIVSAGKFTPPEELYDAGTIKDFISHLLLEITTLIQLFDQKDPMDWQEMKEAFINSELALQPLVDSPE